MGIVVTLGMCFGLFILVNHLKPNSNQLNPFLAGFVLLCGIWNAFWYGTQNIGQFWGQVALGSGLLMIISVVIVFLNIRSRPVIYLVAVLLFGFFMLYSVTIVQLNLGLPIIGS